MTRDRKYKTLYKAACNYLESQIGKDALEHKLNYYRLYKVDNLYDVFWHLLSSLTNKAGMRASIGDIDPLGRFLYDFEPHQCRNHYGDNWRLLFETIHRHHKSPGPMNIKNEGSYWVIFCKAILSGAGFLSRFESFAVFDEFVNGFGFNDIAVAGLPILLEREIYGMGFPLACDWLKEMGYGNYAKPDTHTIDILHGTNVARSRGTYDVFKAMVRMAKVNDELPSVVDRVLWLIGSGKYVGENQRITRQKAAFIRQIQPILNPK